MNSVTWLVTSLQIQDSNNADVMLDSGINVFNIIVNLCSKLHYETCATEVRKFYCVSMEVDFCFGL